MAEIEHRLNTLDYGEEMGERIGTIAERIVEVAERDQDPRTWIVSLRRAADIVSVGVARSAGRMPRGKRRLGSPGTGDDVAESLETNARRIVKLAQRDQDPWTWIITLRRAASVLESRYFRETRGGSQLAPRSSIRDPSSR